MRYLLVIAVLLAVAGATAGSAGKAAVDGPELAFTARIHDGMVRGSAVCVARTNRIGTARRLIGGATAGEFQTAWSPDGARLAIAGSPGLTFQPIRVSRADGSAPRPVSHPRLATEQDSNPAWSPDGAQIAFARYVYYGPRMDYRRAGIWIVDLRTGRERQIDRYFGALAWSPIGDVIATDGSASDEQTRLLTPEGRVVSAFFSSEDDLVTGFAWSPDGERLALGGGAIVNRAGRSLGRYAPPPTDAAVAHSPAWSPDGSTIVYARAAVAHAARPPARYLLPSDLFSAAAAGGDATRLTNTPEISEVAPDFRPAARGRAGRSQACVLAGTAGPDLIRGTAAGDLIVSGAGDDQIHAGGGSDVVVAGAGADFVNAGQGRDSVGAGRGHDRLFLRDGTVDFAQGSLGRDRARADRTDRLVGVERRY